LSKQKLLEAYACCDVFVMPSDIEAFGLSIAEAMAAGKPVIASNVGGVPYVVKHGESGFLFEQRDFLQLAKYAKLLLSDPILRCTFGSNAKVLSQKYNWNSVCEMYEQTYSRLLYAN
jgi:glycosyltransferase involved in cell wall biosynthesis